MRSLNDVEGRLREIAGILNGRRNVRGGLVKKGENGPRRTIGISIVNDDGMDLDLADELLELADDIAQTGRPAQVTWPTGGQAQR